MGGYCFDGKRANADRDAATGPHKSYFRSCCPIEKGIRARPRDNAMDSEPTHNAMLQRRWAVLRGEGIRAIERRSLIRSHSKRGTGRNFLLLSPSARAISPSSEDMIGGWAPWPIFYARVDAVIRHRRGLAGSLCHVPCMRFFRVSYVIHEYQLLQREGK